MTDKTSADFGKFNENGTFQMNAGVVAYENGKNAHSTNVAGKIHGTNITDGMTGGTTPTLDNGMNR